MSRSRGIMFLITNCLMRVTAIKSHDNLHGKQTIQSSCHRSFLSTPRISRLYFVRKRKQHTTFHANGPSMPSAQLALGPMSCKTHALKSRRNRLSFKSVNETEFCIRYFFSMIIKFEPTCKCCDDLFWLRGGRKASC